MTYNVVVVFAGQEGTGSQMPTAASKTLVLLGAEIDPEHRPVIR